MNSLYENASAHDAREFACRSKGEVFAVNKLVGLLILAVLGIPSGEACAQDLVQGQSPQFIFADQDLSASAGLPKMQLPDEEIPQPIAEPLATPLYEDDFDSEGIDGVDEDFRVFDCYPALLESTGTWLRRGFWYAEADAVLFARSFAKTGLTLAFDADVVNPIQRLGTKNMLAIDSAKPGVEGVPRLNVGRFLFRDYMNRDHTMEFTIFGGGNWSQDSALDGGNLVMPLNISNGNPNFSGARRMQFGYDSWYNSFELTYNVKQRMSRDRMELEPSGHWVRRAQPSSTNALLAGVRYFNLDENLNIMAFGIPDADGDSDNETGNYRVQTGNHLIGTELGLSHAYETARWSITGKVKGGMYLNMIHMESNFDVTGNITSGSTDIEGDNLAWVGEAALIGRWHLRPNFSLRTSLEVMHLTGVALAPYQVDFIPSGSPLLSDNSDVVYLGGAIGFESYW